LAGIDHYEVNDTSNFQIDINGLITNKTTLPFGDYWLNISAFDPSNNYCEKVILIAVVDETIPPLYSDLYESANPLELGDMEIFRINATDDSGIKQVRIEIDGISYPMQYISGDMWQYEWTPNENGTYSYIIYIQDNNYVWNSTNLLSIEVVDTKPPSYSNLYESDDPLELGFRC
jgi:hypothetical protein